MWPLRSSGPWHSLSSCSERAASRSAHSGLLTSLLGERPLHLLLRAMPYILWPAVFTGTTKRSSSAEEAVWDCSGVFTRTSCNIPKPWLLL